MDERLAEILDHAEPLSSGSPLDDIETPFRIFAGPGAGKTHWLVEQIKRVIAASERLGPSRRIACISYTSVAAEEVKERLGSAAAHVDVSTIHSFLYRSVVKPYLPGLLDESGDPVVDYTNVSGHRPHRSGYGKVDQWFKIDEVTDWRSFGAFLGGTGTEKERVYNFFESLYWTRSDEGEGWQLSYNRRRIPHQYFPRSSSDLKRYKELFWRQGILDHEDVLYFAVRILEEHPILAQFLSARYPYLFVDEFQDTTPAQTEVLRTLAEAGTTTGVIGDIGQAIYTFAGANPQDLLEFEPEGQNTYHISSNRRSTRPILNLLNRLREGLNQSYHEDGEEEQDPPAPTIVVGSAGRAREYVQEETDGGFKTLTRRNATVRRLAGSQLPDDTYDETWEKLFSADPYRSEWLEALLEATHEAKKQNRYGHAVKIIYRALRTKNGLLTDKLFSGSSNERKLSRDKRRRTAASLLPYLLKRHERHRELSGLEFYLDVREQMGKLPPNASLTRPTRRSNFGQLLDETNYETLFVTAELKSGAGDVKTVHKAKGEEYPVVLSYRESDEDSSRNTTLEHILNPEDAEGEEKRVTYVALSRSEERLFICVEDLSTEDEEALEELDLDVERLGIAAPAS
ncbi:DNA helicase-2/ATP-dependent DNA helicase PcrA [Salinibacter ruber]|uniref:UvrD-helicase domain-containing protein n=1 Tax=Salinibacter ruber TaxID=146919 RepID=UPI0021699ECF|nr:ATP-dependent helicase [Salinibacter ruber]MCS3751393.1 DNA helicase-2/ATP-dependent DNA helicase PcrA [Salinibacter ruber]